MLDRCDFRTCGECSCAPDQCRVQNVGTVTKARDMRGVFLPSTCTLLAIVAFFAVSTAVGITIIQLREDARAYQISQRV